jgi:hypothetical protein
MRLEGLGKLKNSTSSGVTNGTHWITIAKESENEGRNNDQLIHHRKVTEKRTKSPKSVASIRLSLVAPIEFWLIVVTAAQRDLASL